MQTKLTEITYDVHLQEGEPINLPKDAAEIVGPGHWTISIKLAESQIRDHSAFLSSYAPEDEGLYDDYQTG